MLMSDANKGLFGRKRGVGAKGHISTTFIVLISIDPVFLA